MNGRRALMMTLVMFFIGHLIYYYPHLPEKMATHFGFNGEPDGWMSKSEFFVFEIGLLIFIVALFFSISYFLPKMPRGLINMPNKDFRLAPERRDETFRRLRSEIETFQIPLILLLICMNHLTFQANIYRENLSPVSWLIVAAFLIYTFIWAFGFYKKFKIYEN